MTSLSHRSHWRVLARAGVLTITLGLALASPATAASAENRYQQTNLVSDSPDFNPAHIDPNLVNAWGMASSLTSPFWVSDNGTGVTTLYDGTGQPFVPPSPPFQPIPLVVTIPPPAGGSPPSTPTGQVFNGTSDFVVGNVCQPGGSSPCPSLFIFVTEDGTISGWNPNVPALPSTTAILVVDNSASGAVYKGVALGSNATGNFLYVANFHAGTIEVYDKDFNPASLAGSFADPNIPTGFAPFNIQNLSDNLYVTYAKQNAAKHDDVAGEGNGFVNVFDTDGHFIRRVATRGKLNSPWGLVFASGDFGPFRGNDLLVGNFGDGHINAYKRKNGHFKFHGTLRDPDGKRITIDGLWALRFGNDHNDAPHNVLFFTAGPDDETHGLFGSITHCDDSPCP